MKTKEEIIIELDSLKIKYAALKRLETKNGEHMGPVEAIKLKDAMISLLERRSTLFWVLNN